MARPKSIFDLMYGSHEVPCELNDSHSETKSGNAPSSHENAWGRGDAESSQSQASAEWTKVARNGLAGSEATEYEEQECPSRPHQRCRDLAWSPRLEQQQSTWDSAGPAETWDPLHHQDSGTPGTWGELSNAGQGDVLYDETVQVEKPELSAITWSSASPSTPTAREQDNILAHGACPPRLSDGNCVNEEFENPDSVRDDGWGDYQGVAHCPTDKEPFLRVNPVLYNPNLETACPAMQEALQNCYAELARGPRKAPIPEEVRPLICPLWAEDPTACKTDYAMYSIQDIARHLHAEHDKGTLYCPVCWVVFDEAVLRDHHIRLQACISKPKPRYWGLPIQTKLLYKNEAYTNCRNPVVYGEIVRMLRPNLQHVTSMYWDNYTSFVISTVHTEMSKALMRKHWATVMGPLKRFAVDKVELKDQVKLRREQLITKLLLPRVEEHTRRFQRIRRGEGWMKETAEPPWAMVCGSKVSEEGHNSFW